MYWALLPTLISSASSSPTRLHASSLITFFDDAFEHLVTDGRADDYPGLVQRFKSKFSVIDQNIERIAAKLGGLIPNLMRAVLTDEKARLDLKCEEQVLRQHLSTTDLEDDARPALKQKVASVTASLSAKAAKVEESLEELRLSKRTLSELYLIGQKASRTGRGQSNDIECQ